MIVSTLDLQVHAQRRRLLIGPNDFLSAPGGKLVQ